MSDRPEVRPEDALDVAQRALAKANQIDGLQEDVAQLKDDVAQLNLRLSEYDEDREYDDLTRDDKIGMVREYAFERATDGRGRSFDYNDIQNGLWDGEPSRDHCYDLMDWAAQAEGFEFREPTSDNNCLVVDPEVARSRWALLSATTRTAEGVR